jgi:radical SAM superfamily enzyme YgiQ (UPF0313 family)
MAEILLIQPPSTLQRLQKLKNRRPELEAPLPFVAIAPYLLDAGFTVRVLDLRIDDVAALTRVLRESPPLIAGLSVMPGSMLRDTIGITRLIKELSPRTKVVWGGTFPSLHFAICLQVRELDYVACGDGEETLTELALALRDSPRASGPGHVNGLAYRLEDGSIHTTPSRAPIDLDRKPVGAWHLLERYMPTYLGPSGMLSINTARGCPYRCTFCYNTAIYKGYNRYRVKGLDAVLEEVEHLHERYAPRSLIFMDDDFLANRKRGVELLDRIHARFPRLRYRIDARSDEVVEPGVAAHLAGLGLESVFFGVEGVSGPFLERIRKGQGSDDTIEAARVCTSNRIQGTYSFTCGYPDETPGDLYDRVEMARLLGELNPSGRSQIEIISPVIGTPLYADLQGRDLVPDRSVDQWCRFSDWKSADGKGWIVDGLFYESFQLAFFLAFSSGSRLDGGMRLPSRLLAAWSRYRLCGKRPTRLPEFRVANRALKTIIWGGSRGGGRSAARQSVARAS